MSYGLPGWHGYSAHYFVCEVLVGSLKRTFKHIHVATWCQLAEYVSLSAPDCAYEVGGILGAAGVAEIVVYTYNTTRCVGGSVLEAISARARWLAKLERKVRDTIAIMM